MTAMLRKRVRAYHATVLEQYPEHIDMSTLGVLRWIHQPAAAPVHSWYPRDCTNLESGTAAAPQQAARCRLIEEYGQVQKPYLRVTACCHEWATGHTKRKTSSSSLAWPEPDD